MKKITADCCVVSMHLELQKRFLAQPYKQNQVGYAMVGDIEAAGGTITLGGVSNSVDGKML